MLGTRRKKGRLLSIALLFSAEEKEGISLLSVPLLVVWSGR